MSTSLPTWRAAREPIRIRCRIGCPRTPEETDALTGLRKHDSQSISRARSGAGDIERSMPGARMARCTSPDLGRQPYPSMNRRRAVSQRCVDKFPARIDYDVHARSVGCPENFCSIHRASSAYSHRLVLAARVPTPWASGGASSRPQYRASCTAASHRLRHAPPPPPGLAGRGLPTSNTR